MDHQDKRVAEKKNLFAFSMWVLVLPVLTFFFMQSDSPKTYTASMAMATGLPIIFGFLLVLIFFLVAYFMGRWTGTTATSMLGLSIGIIFALCLYCIIEFKRANAEMQKYHPKGTQISSVISSNYTPNFIEMISVGQIVQSASKNVSIWQSGAYSTTSQGECCLNLPIRWNHGMILHVEWDATYYSRPWKEIYMLPKEQIARYTTKRHHQRDVPIPEYEEPTETHLYFLPDDQVEVWVTQYFSGPKSPSGRNAPENPDPVD